MAHKIPSKGHKNEEDWFIIGIFLRSNPRSFYYQTRSMQCANLNAIDIDAFELGADYITVDCNVLFFDILSRHMVCIVSWFEMHTRQILFCIDWNLEAGWDGWFGSKPANY